MKKLKDNIPLLFLTLGFLYLMVYFEILEESIFKRDSYQLFTNFSRTFVEQGHVDSITDEYDHPSVLLFNSKTITYEANCTDWMKDSYRITHICKSGMEQSRDVVLTLFTSIINYREDQTIFDNTLRLHAQFRPHVQPILFVSSPSLEWGLIQKACQLGWHVVTTPQCNGELVPVLKYMFLAAQEIQRSIYYGYANGDVLFDNSIINTLESLQPIMDFFPRHLILGKKTKLKVKNTIFSDVMEMTKMAKEKGVDGWVADVTYFIAMKNGYPWADMPKVLIGRSGYDNWLIRNSEKIGIPVIDVSTTALTVHQISGDKSKIPVEDVNINVRITGGFDFTKGLISCAPFKTNFDSQGEIVLLRRIKSGMCGPEDWGRRLIDMTGVDVDEPFNIDQSVDPDEDEAFLANITRKTPPSEPSQYLVDPEHLELARNCSYWNVTELRITTICSPAKQDNVLVTLFTTMHDSMRNHYLFENIIYLHAFLKPRVQPMMFVSSPIVEKDLVKIACALGWHVLTAPSCDRNKLPVLRDMFLAAQNVQESTFYGYANGDIVFDESMITTLEYIDTIKMHFNQALFVGRRTNIKLAARQVIPDLDNLRYLANKKGTDGWVAAIDYFITTKDGFPWHTTPKLVIGRVAYDNWMVKTAIQGHMFAVDITNTTLSVHQSGQSGYYSSHYRRDANANLKMVGKLDFTRGLITCMPLKTVHSTNGTIKIVRRSKYGMCGAGHWSKRRNPEHGPYGHEVTVDFDPAIGMPSRKPK